MAAKRNSPRDKNVSVEPYKLLFESNPHPMWVYDLDTLAFLAVNDTAVRKYGFSRRQFLNMTIKDIRPSENISKLMERTTHGTDGLDEAGTWQHRKKDGSIIDVEITSHTILWDGRRAKLILAHDITERKRAEEALKQSEEWFRSLFEKASDGIFYLSLNGGLVAVNESFAKMHGYSVEEMQRMNIKDLDTPETSRQFAERMRRTLAEESLTFEVEHYHKSGHTIPLEVTTSMITIGGEQFILAIHRDITERRETEEMLRGSNARMRAIVDGAPFGAHSYELHPDGRLIFSGSNRSADGILDIDHSPLIGKTIEEAFPGLATTSIPNAYRHVATTGEIYETDQVAYKDDRILGVFEIHAFQTGSNQMTVFFRDITERKRAEEALRETNEALRALIEASPVSIVTLDPDGNVKSWNPASERMFGWTAAEVLGRFLPYISKDKEDEHRALRQRVLRGNSFMGVEVRRLKKDGSPIDLSVSTAPLHDAKGNVTGIMGVNVNISERKRAEDELRKLSRKDEEALRIARMGHWEFDVATGLFTFNDQYYSLHGTTAEEAGGYQMSATKFAEQYVHSDDAQTVGESIQQAIQTNDPNFQLQTEARILRADGEVRNITVWFRVEKDAHGRTTKLHGVNQDITEHKRAEGALRESEHRFRTTLYSIGDGVITTDTVGTVLQMNRVAEALTGWTELDARGKSVQQVFRIVDEETGLPVESPVTQVLRRGVLAGLVGRTLLVAKDGTRRPISDSGAPIQSPAGETTGVVLVFNDQSERRELQAQFLQAQKMEAVGRLAGGVAHDFNNMIGVILGYAKLIENQLNPLDPLQKNVKAIAGAAERSANLIKQLLAFARKQVIAPIPLNLNDSLSTLHKMLVRLIGEDITLTLSPGDNLWNTKIDPTQVDQILANLSTNARDAIDDVGAITIETANIVIDESHGKGHLDFVPGEYVMLTFSDTGKGMDKATQARIFEPFFTTKPKEQGTGLGLATVFGIVKQNNGFIHVYSEPTKGTSFKIYLPRFHGEVETRVEKLKGVSLQGTETILIVEDEEQLLELSCAALEMHGYTVLSAKSPGEAVLLCERTEKKIDLILTDVVMPGMNGKELKERLDKMKLGMKCIFMSGYPADVVAHRGILDEGIFFLQKPFTPLTLAKKVREVLNG